MPVRWPIPLRHMRKRYYSVQKFKIRRIDNSTRPQDRSFTLLGHLNPDSNSEPPYLHRYLLATRLTVSVVMITMLYGTAAMMPYLDENRKIVYAIIANVGMFEIIIVCILIYGVFGKKPCIILPWLITSWLFCISLLGLSALGTILIVLQYTGDQETTSEVSTTSAAYGISAIVMYYSASVISSRRDEMLHNGVIESAQGLMRRDYEKYTV